MNDGIALFSESHSGGFTPCYSEQEGLSPECFETWFSHTIALKGKNVTFIYKTEKEFTQRLKEALKFGEKKLTFHL